MDVCVCGFVCQHDNFRMSKHRMMKLGGRCIVQKISASSNLGVIAPGSVHLKNVTFGYDVGKISAECLVAYCLCLLCTYCLQYAIQLSADVLFCYVVIISILLLTSRSVTVASKPRLSSTALCIITMFICALEILTVLYNLCTAFHYIICSHLPPFFHSFPPPLR